MPLAEVENRAILEALYIFKGNKTRAAEALGVTLNTVKNHCAKIQAEGEWVVPERHHWSIEYDPELQPD